CFLVKNLLKGRMIHFTIKIALIIFFIELNIQQMTSGRITIIYFWQADYGYINHYNPKHPAISSVAV
ncbi:hypothetical protein ACYTU5_00005, partial (plasmid) [Escherichia coli]